MNTIDHGKLWPGIITRVDSHFVVSYKTKTQVCNSYREAEEWVAKQKESELGSTIYV